MYLASGLWICLPTYSCTHVQLPMYGYMHDLCVQDWAPAAASLRAFPASGFLQEGFLIAPSKGRFIRDVHENAKDVNDPDRVAIPEAHLSFYYSALPPMDRTTGFWDPMYLPTRKRAQGPDGCDASQIASVQAF